MRLFNKQTKPTIEQVAKRKGFEGAPVQKKLDVGFIQPATVANMAMDSASTALSNKFGFSAMPTEQARFFVEQNFIGYAMCVHIAKHWIVKKACSMTARDAIRNGYRINCDHADALEIIDTAEVQKQANSYMQELITKGREMGGAAALFLVESTDKDYYEKPFNPDGVTKGSYRGIKIIDASWMTPDLTASNLTDPASPDFYEPTFWRIGTRRYHKSHFVIFVPYPVADLAKPTYNYFGVSVPERISERVYAAERSANEAPQLLMTKRLLNMGIAGLADSDPEAVSGNLEFLANWRDNYGVNISDAEDNLQQFDTALGDIDTVIMTQYQLVASAAGVPATKLLGTAPKGFNATGEYDEASYREELESIQTHDLEPMLMRHLSLILRSNDINHGDVAITWHSLDSPTEKELAETDLVKAQTDAVLVQIGALSSDDVRERLANDYDSDYFGIGEMQEPDLSEYLDDAENNTF
jgi:uncharacterized protein